MTKLKTMISVMLIIGGNQGWDWRCPKHFGCGGVWVQNPGGIIKTRRDTTNYTNYGSLSFTPPSRQRWCWCWPKLWIVFSCWVESRQIQKREKRRACYYFWPPYAGFLGNLSVHFVLYSLRLIWKESLSSATWIPQTDDEMRRELWGEVENKEEWSSDMNC